MNVLLIRTDHLGDLLLSTPIIRNVKESLPASSLTLVASPHNAGALAGWSVLDRILIYDSCWPLAEKWAFVKRLRQERWDLCLVLSPRSGAYVLGSLSRAPVRAGIVYSRRLLPRLFSPWLLTHPLIMRIDETLAAGGQVPHEVDQLLDLARRLGLKAEPYPLEFPLTDANVKWGEDFLRCHGIDPAARPVIAVHGSPKWLSQGWSARDFVDMAKAAAAVVPDAALVFTFGPGDAALAEAIAASVPLGEGAEEAENSFFAAARNMAVGQWAGLYSLCRVIISPDTGSLHLAAALHRPVVAVYEDRTFLHNSRQWAPWKTPHAIIRKTGPEATRAAIVAAVARLAILS